MEDSARRQDMTGRQEERPGQGESDAEPARLLAEPRGGVPPVIDDAQGFARACRELSQERGPLAADAERASGFRYGHDDYLVQFKRGSSDIFLLDPQALNRAGCDWDDFNRAVDGAQWIIHDSPQDLPGFHDLGMKPSSLFDTELTARMLNLRHFGLSAVTEHFLGLSLAKEHSAADWSHRPLPRDWRNYAALDVELLVPLRERMMLELERQGKEEWARQEFVWLLDKRSQRKPRPEQPWRHLSQISTLRKDRRGLAVARALWTKREELGREYDIAPSLLLTDRSIIAAAQAKPRNAAQFRAIRSLNERVRIHAGGEQDRMFERYAPIQRKVRPKVWRETILEALDLPADELPVGPKPQADQNNAPKSMQVWRQRHPERMARLEAARKTVARIGQETNTPVDVLIKPKYLRNLCWTDEPGKRDVADFLEEQGARPWQVSLLSESLSRAIM